VPSASKADARAGVPADGPEGNRRRCQAGRRHARIPWRVHPGRRHDGRGGAEERTAKAGTLGRHLLARRRRRMPAPASPAGSMTVPAGCWRFRLRRRQPGRAGRRGQYRDSTRTAGTVPRIMNNDRQLHLRMTQGTVGTVESDVLAFRLRASRQTRERRFPRFDCPYCPQPAQAPCAS